MGEVSEPDVVRRGTRFEASPAEVWTAVTHPDHLGAWFGASAEIDLRPGGAVRFIWPDGAERRGLVLEVDEGRRFSFRWRAARGASVREPVGRSGASTVTFEVVLDGEATRLLVTERSGALPDEAVEGASA